jgi:hypothetical protein
MKPAIYGASRASIPDRPAMWESLRDEHGWNMVSTWHRPENMDHTPGVVVDMRVFWDRIQQEVAACDALVLYVEPNDLPLKGAFVEAGMALARGNRVVIVFKGPTQDGDHLRRCLGSWITHRNVMVCESIWTAEYIITRGLDYAALQATRR